MERSPSSVLHRLLLLGDTDSLALVASGLGVLTADTQAPASLNFKIARKLFKSWGE